MNEFVEILTFHHLPTDLENEIIEKLEELNWEMIVSHNQYDETEIHIPIKKLEELFIK